MHFPGLSVPLQKRFFWDALQRHRDNSTLKQVHLMIPLSLEKRKVTRWLGRLFYFSDVPLGLEQPDALGVVSWCNVVVKQPRLSSFLVHSMRHKSRDLLGNLLIDRLTLWQELATNDATNMNVINMNLTILFSSITATSGTFIGCFCACFPGRTQKFTSHHRWWLYEASLVQFQDAR